MSLLLCQLAKIHSQKYIIVPPSDIADMLMMLFIKVPMVKPVGLLGHAGRQAVLQCVGGHVDSRGNSYTSYQLHISPLLQLLSQMHRSLCL